MNYYKKRKKFTRVFYILFIAILLIVGFKLAWHVGSSTVELMPASSARVADNYKTLPAVPNHQETFRIVIDPGHGERILELQESAAHMRRRSICPLPDGLLPSLRRILCLSLS